MAKKKPHKFDTALSCYLAVGEPRHGGSGTVYKVEDENGATWALKCLSPQYVSKDKRKRFMNELLFCSQCEHPNVVKVKDWGYVLGTDEDKLPFYVMPFYEDTLRDPIKLGVPHDKVLPYFLQILDGVEAAHLPGHWHRDLKPENILYDQPKESIVVADWGIAHFSEDVLHTAGETRDKDKLANFQYAAPEQRKKGDSRSVDHRADIFALGMILNEMFTQELPIGTAYKKIESVNADYAFLDDLVDKMLSNSPDERPKDIDEIKRLLKARQVDSVRRQKLSTLKGVVIPRSELDDPLINDPVRLVGVDYSSKDHLILELSQPVNVTWIKCFKSIARRSYMTNEDPRDFVFWHNNLKANLPVPEKYVSHVVDSFKEYLKEANEHYKRVLIESERTRKAEEERRLQEQIAAEEKRQRILEKIKL